ncbi:MAG: hypothetical protein Altm2KO_22980 [Alteromonas macleodii]|jgi:hypothetical protein|uniref:hypothetical protein n=1 Tax=Alteromonas TaxID=226 RepID=UPI001EF25F14|nr:MULTISPECIES: hypothetical protein [Alteromonas]MCG7639798.1 hypothetical protein [Alteromonas sp. CNT1-28]MCG7813547.1 hypothetical protein [Alteromonas sp. MCA-1]MCZ4241305.1 hypothetical protein [Alteromonas macleodii]
MSLNKKLVEFRKKIKANHTKVITSIIGDHSVNICIFCGENENLTREHVIPQWVYDRCTKRTFITTTNKNAQTYNKTAVPACQNCNNSILGELERFLTHKFNEVDLQSQYFTDDEINKIILWLEIIEYKFHVLDLRRNLNKVQGSEYIPYIGKMPIAMFQGPMDQSPSKVFSNLRNALKTLSVKSKAVKHNSLCILRTTNPDFHFFHSTNNFIFIELAQYNVAFFYFYKQVLSSSDEAATLAKEIVQKEYSGTGT